MSGSKKRATITRTQSHSTIPSGTFTIGVGGYTTAGISTYATLDTVRNAIMAVSDIYNVTYLLPSYCCII